MREAIGRLGSHLDRMQSAVNMIGLCKQGKSWIAGRIQNSLYTYRVHLKGANQLCHTAQEMGSRYGNTMHVRCNTIYHYACVM